MFKIKDVYKFVSSMDGKEYLFGTVVSHYKHEKGHHIITSEVVGFDTDKLIAKTKSGSTYEIENIFDDKMDFYKFIEDNYGNDVCENPYYNELGIMSRADYYKYITK